MKSCDWFCGIVGLPQAQKKILFFFQPQLSYVCRFFLKEKLITVDGAYENSSFISDIKYKIRTIKKSVFNDPNNEFLGFKLLNCTKNQKIK